MVVGITGSVGSGKTVLACELKKMGACVIDGDLVARNLIEERAEIRDSLRHYFGAEFFDEAGHLRRHKLGQVVFSKKEKLALLNRIVWPHLLGAIKQKIHKCKEDNRKALVVVDMAILFESEAEFLFDKIVVVAASLENRLKWLSQERSWSKREILNRIHSQMDLQEKRNRADLVIENNGTLEEIRLKAKKLLLSLSEDDL